MVFINYKPKLIIYPESHVSFISILMMNIYRSRYIYYFVNNFYIVFFIFLNVFYNSRYIDIIVYYYFTIYCYFLLLIIWQQFTLLAILNWYIIGSIHYRSKLWFSLISDNAIYCYIYILTFTCVSASVTLWPQ